MPHRPIHTKITADTSDEEIDQLAQDIYERLMGGVTEAARDELAANPTVPPEKPTPRRGRRVRGKRDDPSS